MGVGIFIAGGVEPSQKEIVKAMVNTICKMYNNVKIFTTNKDSKLKYLLQDNSELVNIQNVVDAKTWLDKYKESLITLENYKIDKMFIIKQTIMQTYNINNASVLLNYLQNWKSQPEFSMKFQMMKALYEKICFITAIASKCKTIELVIDPQQINLGNNIDFKHGYKQFYILNKKELNLEYANFYEPYYESNCLNTKSTEFCFACTAITKDRSYIAKYANQTDKFNSNWLVKIVVNNKAGKKLSQQEYYEWLSQSKYTTIIPSYDNTTFSIIRMVEALKFDCIPLVHVKCNLKDLKCTFPELYEYITNNLLVEKISCIQEKIKQIDYNKILNELHTILKNTGMYDVQKLKNKIEKEWGKMQ